MRIVRTVAELRDARSGKVGLVPTMGALHEGHLSLMRQARQACDTLIVSLFVNPTQFGPNEDFSRYPRNEEQDAKLVEAAGVDVLFAPSVDEIYPRKTTVVSVKGIPDLWEGALRPGHFDGVATVVCKLFNIAAPDVAFFGLKDLQQCAVIGRMVEDLNVPVQLQFCETVREKNGLAMSSRNAYLSLEERRIAPVLYRELSRCAQAFSTDALPPKEVAQQLEQSRAALTSAGALVDYLELVDTSDLSPRFSPHPGDSVIGAIRLGSTRLIDNVQIAK